MKKWLIPIIVLISVVGFAYAAELPLLVPYDRPELQGQFLYCYNPMTTVTSKILTGSPVIYASTATFGGIAYGIGVSTTGTANDEYVIGVAVEDILAGTWGKVQTWGYCKKIKVQICTAGEALATAGTGGFADTSTTAGAVFATALDTDTSSGTVRGWIYR